jgi:hypothetical protein
MVQEVVPEEDQAAEAVEAVNSNQIKKELPAVK